MKAGAERQSADERGNDESNKLPLFARTLPPRHFTPFSHITNNFPLVASLVTEKMGFVSTDK